MLAAIANAKHQIKLASYLFADDVIGWQFAVALAERMRGAGASATGRCRFLVVLVVLVVLV